METNFGEVYGIMGYLENIDFTNGASFDYFYTLETIDLKTYVIDCYNHINSVA